MRKNIIDFGEYVDYEKEKEMISALAEKYDFLNITEIGKSILGRSIPMLTLGDGNKSVLYIAAHHGMEWITSAILLRFVNEYCEYLSNTRTVFGISLPYLFEARTVHIIPMLNPDGVEYSLHGIGKDHVMYDRLIKMNGGSEDFSNWQANARGVDINHNYDAGFEEYKRIEKELGIFGGAPTKYSGEYPCSEPESFSLCHLVRIKEVSAVLTLHSQGEEIYYTSGDVTAKASLAVGKIISRLTGYKLSKPEGTAAYGGFTDWFIREFDRPSFTIEVGKGKNPLPFSEFEKIYSELREMLFTFPTLV